jgi:tRNA(Ile2) C34 agmatinyltransferase TiaS
MNAHKRKKLARLEAASHVAVSDELVEEVKVVHEEKHEPVVEVAVEKVVEVGEAVETEQAVEETKPVKKKKGSS